MPVHIGVFTYMYNVRVFLFFFLSPLYSGKSTLLAAALGQISRLRGKYFSQFQSIPLKYKQPDRLFYSSRLGDPLNTKQPPALL